MANMKISEQGISLIKQFESCRLTAYKALKTEKYYTIGWGHYGEDVKAGQTISQDEADALFLVDIERFVKYTNHYVTSFVPTQNQFDALVSFCYNCGPGNLSKLVKGATPEQVAEKITNYNKSGGKVISGLTKRREIEKELFCRDMEVKAMSTVVGSARIDENGKITGGTSGDQTGNEVAMQNYYQHSKGWYLFRAKSAEIANALASAMMAACKNDKVGYDQNNRAGIITQIKKYGNMEKIDTVTECDCSSLVRACCIEAGFDPGNFTTATEAAALAKTGKFQNKVTVTTSTKLYNGDILVTKTKGHTVIVVSGNERTDESNSSTSSTNTSTVKKTVAVDPAKSFDKKIAGKYTVTANSGLNLRAGAGTGKSSLAIMEKGEVVQNYGYYTLANGTKWYLVKYEGITGFCSSKYLKKI